MGCWNQTCFVTRVPITAGEKVKLFVLQGHGYAYSDKSHLPLTSTIGATYATDRWSPVGGPVTGAYDDYGRVEDFVDDAAHRALVGYLKAEHGLSLEAFFEKVHREDNFHTKGITFASGRKGVTCTVIHPYSYCMVPVSIYAVVVKAYAADVDPRHRHDAPAARKTRRAAKAEDLRALLDRRRQAAAKIDLFEDHETREALRRLVARDRLGSLNAENVLERPLLDAAAADPIEFDKVLDFALFACAVEDLRTEWAPQCGQGSQTTAFRLHAARNAAALAYCRRHLFRPSGGADD